MDDPSETKYAFASRLLDCIIFVMLDDDDDDDAPPYSSTLVSKLAKTYKLPPFSVPALMMMTCSTYRDYVFCFAQQKKTSKAFPPQHVPAIKRCDVRTDFSSIKNDDR